MELIIENLNLKINYYYFLLYNATWKKYMCYIYITYMCKTQICSITFVYIFTFMSTSVQDSNYQKLIFTTKVQIYSKKILKFIFQSIIKSARK